MFDELKLIKALQIGGAKLRRGSEILSSRFDAAVARLPIDVYHGLRLRQLVSQPSHHRFLLASDIEARQKSGELLFDKMINFYQDEAVREHSYTNMGTFAWNLGVSPLAEPVIRLGALRRRIDKIMRRHALHGVYFIEFDIILRLPGEQGPRLHAHVHMWCWHAAHELKPKILANDIMETHHLLNDMDARSVVFTRRRRSAANVVKLGAYLTKVPRSVKQRRKRRNGRGFRLSPERGKYSQRMTLRMIEILSQVSIYECVGGIGQGTAVRRAWKHDLHTWARDREWRSQLSGKGRRISSAEEAARLWRKLRRAGVLRTQPVVIER